MTPTVLVNGNSNPEQDALTMKPPSSTARAPLPPFQPHRFFDEISADEQQQQQQQQQQQHFTPPTQRSNHARLASSSSHTTSSPPPPSKRCLPLPDFSSEDLRRALAADLLRADIQGRPKRLRGGEAKQLADALLRRLRSQQQQQQLQPPPPMSSSIGYAEDEDLFNVAAANWLGLAAGLGMRDAVGVVVGSGRWIRVSRFRVSGDGYESPVDDEEDEVDGGGGDGGEHGREMREVFDVGWSLGLGGMVGRFDVKGLVLEGGERRSDGKDMGEVVDEGGGYASSKVYEESSYKEKYEALRRELMKREEEVRLLRDRVLEAVL